jgi:HSP20 family protein
MAEAAAKVPVKTETAPATQPAHPADWQPFEALRNQVDRLLHDFQTGFLQAPTYRSLVVMEPFWCRDLGFNVTPAIDIVEKEKTFELTAELPGLDAKSIDLQLSEGVWTIKGEKEEKEERPRITTSPNAVTVISAARCKSPAASTSTRSKRTLRMAF